MSSKSTKRRQIVLRSDNFYATKRKLFPGVIEPDYTRTGVATVTGTQVTESEGHPWTSVKKYRGQDVGGPFRTEKIYVDDYRGRESPSPMYSFAQDYDVQKFQYIGPVYVDQPSSLPAPPIIESSDDALMAWGTKAIALCKPTSSYVSLSTTIGELMREGLPSLIGASAWKDRFQSISSAGSEYLNVVFGWEPLVNDIKDVVSLQNKSRKIIQQYERDAGRLVRRQYEFPVIKEISEPVLVREATFPFWYGNPGVKEINAFTAQGYPNAARPMYAQHSTEVRRWFSGAFTYYIPSRYATRDRWEQASLELDKLLGIEITPETLWNLTPWSWAADWVGNYGDVLSNLSDYATDGLVLRYGYMMEHSISKMTYTIPDFAFKGYGPRTFSQTHVREVKKRVAATPFGFGLTFDGFSSKQKAILAALGISRKS